MSELKLTAGCYYETRDGRKAFVAAVDETRATYKQAIGWDLYDTLVSWSIDGRYDLGRSAYDLVKPWRDEPKFKVGDRVRSKPDCVASQFTIEALEWAELDRYWICIGDENWERWAESDLELAPPEPAKVDSDGERWEEACRAGKMKTTYRAACEERDKAIAEVAEQAKVIEGLHKERDALAEERDALAAKVARVEKLLAQTAGTLTYVDPLRNALNPPAKPEPKRVKGWVAAWRLTDGGFATGTVWESREDALRANKADPSLAAIVEIDVAEGEGL